MGNVKYFKKQSDLREWVRENQNTLKKLYITKNMTARKVAENQNIHFDQRFPKILTEEIGTKGMGLGGTRQGSGNKKGIKFCGTCRKQVKDCTC